MATACFRQQRCQLCAKYHSTLAHKCIIESCKKIEEKCQHTLLKCANCFEAHEANSSACTLNEKESAEIILKRMSSKSNHTKSGNVSTDIVNVDEDTQMNESNEWESFETIS